MIVNRFLLNVIIITFLFFWMSCASSPTPLTQNERESANQAKDILLEHRMTPILKAFDSLSSWSYTRYEFSENRGASQYQSSTGLVHIDSTGKRSIITDPDSTLTDNLYDTIQAILPGDPPYFSDQFKDDFVYEMRRDTSYWSRPAHEIRIMSRPDTGHDLVTSSLIYDTASNQLVHVNFQSIHRTILFNEASSYQIQLRPIGASWVPHRVSMKVDLNLPLGKHQQYVRNVTFYNYSFRSES